MIQGIRELMARCDAPERAVYEALDDEASGWQIRLGELNTNTDDENLDGE